MASVLSVKNLSVVLDASPIIEKINFSINPGESLAIIGPNGSGKTVLIKSLLNLLPYRGEVRWTKNIKIGYVPQKIDADRHLPVTLEDLIAGKMRILGLQKNDCNEAIGAVGLNEEALKTPVGHLSGGQFQKGLIALALLGKPQVIILDEPTASLDQPSEEHIYELIHRLQDQYQLTIVIVSHDLSMVYHQVQKVLSLNKQLLFFGKPEEVLNPKNLKQVFGASIEFYDNIHKNHGS